MPRHAGRTAIYRLYDKTGQLLYIGISHKPDVRWGQHSEEKEWWPEVDRRDVEWLATRASAERAELAAITAEKPLHNKAGTIATTVNSVGGKTPTRPIRVGLPLWAAFGNATAEQGSDRSATLRAFIAWYLRRPGAELPERPDIDNWRP